MEELPLDHEYWARKSSDFATLAKIEWVFSMAGKILGMDCR